LYYCSSSSSSSSSCRMSTNMSAICCRHVKICRQRVGDDLSCRHHFLPCRRHVGRHVADNQRHVSVSAFLTLLPTSQMATFPAKLVSDMVIPTYVCPLFLWSVSLFSVTFPRGIVNGQTFFDRLTFKLVLF